jgi:hypothetical protein
MNGTIGASGHDLISAVAGAAVKFVRIQSTDAPTRHFAVTIPFAPGVRSFFFDYETTVADACETIADVANLPFPPYALFSNGCPLTDDEFIFDVAVDRLEVRLQPGDPNQLRIREKLGAGEQLISKEWRSVAEIKAAIGGDIDLVAAGKVLLDSESIVDAGLTRDSCVYVSSRPSPLLGFGDAPHVFTQYDFVLSGRERVPVAIPFAAPKTVTEAKAELAKKIGRPTCDMSIIDTTQMICLDDEENLATLIKPGRPFTVHCFDRSYELRESDRKVIQKFMPGRDLEEGKILYLRCAQHADIFPRTCKRKGFS